MLPDISLSSWIRDYLYLPLTGTRVGQSQSRGGLAEITSRRRTTALFATWGIMGLWHGANWTFVVWGLYHASWVYGHRLIKPALARLPDNSRVPLGWLISLPIGMLGWIPFRANSVSDVLHMFGTVLDPRAYLRLGLRENTYLVAALMLVGVCLCWLMYTRGVPALRRRKVLWPVGVSVAMGVLLAFDFIYLRPIAQFIYFQF